MRDRSLEEFLDEAADRAAESESEPDADPDSGADTDPAPDPGAASTTYQWTPDGAACADCGATIDRRWRDGDRLVCADCKDW